MPRLFQSPQRGLFISYLSPTSRPILPRSKFQSPQRGLFISYVALSESHPTKFHVSVPSAGIVYFLRKNMKTIKGPSIVSVPSAGIVYFLHEVQRLAHWLQGGTSFSPLSGDCLFLTSTAVSTTTGDKGFSPLSGDCLFLTCHVQKPFAYFCASFQSPQRGLFISYSADCSLTFSESLKVSVPSAGIVYFLLSKRRSP